MSHEMTWIGQYTLALKNNTKNANTAAVQSINNNSRQTFCVTHT